MTDPTLPAPPEPVDTQAMPRHTTPTWEVEMLISGAAVFAVLQLPSWLTHQVFHWLPRLNDDWGGALSTLYIYLMSATVMLALTFIFHLALRAHWIALIGMHSVFPGGIRWANARMGPVQLAVEQKRLGSVARAVDRADNRATVVFAVGVMLTTMLVALCLIVAPMFAAILLADHVLGSSTLITLCLVALPLLIALPYQWARRYDQRKGAQLPANSRLRRVMTWIFSSNIRLGSSRNSYAWTLLATNVGRHRINVAVWLVLLPVLGAAALSIVSMQSPNALASYGLFPYDPGGMRAQNTAYYDDQRDIGHLQTVPYIQSAIITGPYVRLVVPWRPDVDARAVREQCSKDLPKQTAAERASSTLDCLGALLAVRLDGKPLTTLRFDSGQDPRTRLPALVAMIDVRGLAPGRHQLSVLALDSTHANTAGVDLHGHGTSAAPAAQGRKPQRLLIPFWR